MSSGRGRLVGSGRRLGVARALVDGVLVPGDVEIVEDRVSAVGLSPAGEGLAIPGLVDIQVNGYAGVDLGGADVDGMHHVARALAADGVLAYGPTIVTSPEAEAIRGIRTIGEAQRANPVDGAAIIGAHVEGPFLSFERRGVHLPELLRDPDVRLTDRYLAAGPVTMLTLAPELPGAVGLIAHVAARGIVVSLGHSDATAAQARAGFDAGARATTHTWNGMRPIDRREPGIVGVALTDDRVRVGLIADGVHVAPELLLMTWRSARGRICLVTDAVAAAGAPDGTYRIGEVVIERRAGRVHDRQGRVGGGTTTLLTSVALAVRSGIDIPAAVAGATSVPAALLGRRDLGVLRPGSPADLLVVTDDLGLRSVLRGGRVIDRAA